MSMCVILTLMCSVSVSSWIWCVQLVCLHVHVCDHDPDVWSWCVVRAQTHASERRRWRRSSRSLWTPWWRHSVSASPSLSAASNPMSSRNLWWDFTFVFVCGDLYCEVLCVASQHWSPEGKRNGERKRPTFHPQRPRTICVQPDKYWHCFEGNLGETAERRGRARMGLSERYDAILSWNWNWNWFFVWCRWEAADVFVHTGYRPTFCCSVFGASGRWLTFSLTQEISQLCVLLCDADGRLQIFFFIDTGYRSVVCPALPWDNHTR